MIETAAIVAALLMSLVHLKERPDLQTWLKQLGSNRSHPCCDTEEAEPMVDPDWRSTELDQCKLSDATYPDGNMPTEYCVRLENHFQIGQWDWWTVPSIAVVRQPNRAGPALLWLYWAATGKPYIRCFLPGATG